MEHKDFVYWMQGYVEITGGRHPTEHEWKIIVDHLQTCFNKITPPSPTVWGSPSSQPITSSVSILSETNKGCVTYC